MSGAILFMKIILPILFLASLTLSSCSNGQTKQPSSPYSMSRFEYTVENAHPKAKALMAEDFFWSPIEETAPFGSDDGSDAAYGFREWRLLNRKTSPVVYLNDLIRSWQYPYFDYNEMDTAKIEAYISSKPSLDENEIQLRLTQLKEAFKNSADTSMNKLNDQQLRELVISASAGMGERYLVGQDNAIIGTGFAQLVLEGTVDEDIKDLTATAIKRQLLPLLLTKYDPKYQDTRKEQLTKMLDVINKVN